MTRNEADFQAVCCLYSPEAPFRAKALMVGTNSVQASDGNGFRFRIHSVGRRTVYKMSGPVAQVFPGLLLNWECSRAISSND